MTNTELSLKTVRFEMLLTREQREWLTQKSVEESARIGQTFSRADWIRKKIDQAMAREARKK